jgi:hypothetical protein
MLSIFSYKEKNLVVTGAFGKVSHKYHMLKRDLCPICQVNLVAVNYIREGVRHYRNCCASCARKGRKLKVVPTWTKAGYKKKDRCELCNFKAKTIRQLFVWYVDGNLKNANWLNLKTVCANCQIDLATSTNWKPATIVPDF